MPRVFKDAELIKRELNGIGNVHGGIIAAIKSIIDDIPAADVEEVRHGHWIKTSPLSNPFCSECHKYEKSGENKPYCSECGARMDGKENEE